MKRLPVLLSLLLCLQFSETFAQRIPLDSLSGVSTSFAMVRSVQTRPGRAQQLRLLALPGDAFTLHLPFVPNRFEPLVADGTAVVAGDAVARISGPELELWLLEAQTVAARFEDAQRRYESNRTLFEQQALDAATWLNISERYRSQRIEEYHVRHVLEWMDLSGGSRESAVLRAPRAGLLLYAEAPDAAAVLSLLDTASLRLSGWVASESQQAPAALETGDCTLQIDRVEARVSGFARRVWSGPVGDCLPAHPGLRVSGRLLYRFRGFAVPRAAVFRLDGQPRIAVDRGADLELVGVAIAGEDGDSYYVTSSTDLDGLRVLSRSTSALQGVLIGLGGEG